MTNIPTSLSIDGVDYAGDVTRENGRIYLWKTSYKEKPDTQLVDYRMQLDAYMQALE